MTHQSTPCLLSLQLISSDYARMGSVMSLTAGAVLLDSLSARTWVSSGKASFSSCESVLPILDAASSLVLFLAPCRSASDDDLLR